MLGAFVRVLRSVELFAKYLVVFVVTVHEKQQQALRYQRVASGSIWKRVIQLWTVKILISRLQQPE